MLPSKLFSTLSPDNDGLELNPKTHDILIHTVEIMIISDIFCTLARRALLSHQARTAERAKVPDASDVGR